MPASPPVTFAVPVYNGERFLGRTLETILAQRTGNFRLVVVDNRSTDRSVDVARSFHDDRLQVALADTHVSMSANWNRALSHIGTPYGIIAHADDEYEQDYLGEMLPLIESYPDAFLAHCRVSNIDEHGSVVDLALEHYKEQFWPAGETYVRPPCEEAAWLRKGNYLSAPSAIFRMEHVRTIGSFEERYQYVTDWEYWLRGVFAGFRIVGTRHKLVRYRKHASSLTKAAETTLTRYMEEIELIEWLARRGFGAGCFTEDRPDYGLVSNTLMSELADRLAAGDRAGAATLAHFARQRIPRFAGSARDIALRGTLPFGVVGGRVLAWARELYVRNC